MYLLFPDQASALEATSTISSNMGIPINGGVTSAWDVPREDANGSWVVTKPEDRFMTSVVGFVVGEPVWPDDEGM